ncbi:uncharacterized protein LOC129602311 [Paramacrobiotus metropolitanus]|uniref:uncharacterized protein LOC129602311 n=1 Tax=Paramacrobiotus metropolitanus TaxID=2943436 RepID=UPI0024463F68|nr:uncharacterized protein LOC129602311 [Paramacrobiotus metropolitanus]
MDDSMETPEQLPVSTGLPRTTPPSSPERVRYRKSGKPLTSDIGESDSSSDEESVSIRPPTPVRQLPPEQHVRTPSPPLPFDPVHRVEFSAGDGVPKIGFNAAEFSHDTQMAAIRLMGACIYVGPEAEELHLDHQSDVADSRAEREAHDDEYELDAFTDHPVEPSADPDRVPQIGASADPRDRSTRRPDPSRIVTKRLGRAALRDKYRQMNPVEVFLPRLAFQRVVRVLTWTRNPEMRMQVGALGLLQEVAERFVIECLTKGAACAAHAKRKTLRREDTALAQYARGENWLNIKEFNPHGTLDQFLEYLEELRLGRIPVSGPSPERSALSAALPVVVQRAGKRPMVMESSSDDESDTHVQAPPAPTQHKRGAGSIRGTAILGKRVAVPVRVLPPAPATAEPEEASGPTAANARGSVAAKSNWLSARELSGMKVQSTRSPFTNMGTAVCSRGGRRGRAPRGMRGSHSTRPAPPARAQSPSPSPARSVQPGTAVCSRGGRRGRAPRGMRGSHSTRPASPACAQSPSPSPARSVQPVRRRGTGGAKRICLGRPNGVNPSLPASALAQTAPAPRSATPWLDALGGHSSDMAFMRERGRDVAVGPVQQPAPQLLGGFVAPNGCVVQRPIVDMHPNKNRGGRRKL